MNKNVMVKGLIVLIILIFFGFVENIFNQFYLIVKVEKNVKEIIDVIKELYNLVVVFVGGIGVVVGKNIIVINKYIVKSNDIFKNRVLVYYLSKGKGGGNYDVKDIVEYFGKEDFVIVYVYEISIEGLNFNKNVSYIKFVDGVKVKDRIFVIGYLKGV